MSCLLSDSWYRLHQIPTAWVHYHKNLLSRVAFYLSDCPLPILNSTLLILRLTNGLIFLCCLLPDFQFTDRPIIRWSSFFNFTFCHTLFSAFSFPLDLRLANQPTNRQEFSIGQSVGWQTDRLIAFFIFSLVGPSVGPLIFQSGGCNSWNLSVTGQKYNWNLAFNTRKDANIYPGWHRMDYIEYWIRKFLSWRKLQFSIEDKATINHQKPT